jgi:2-polyprenyl-3-methyl-5-hydroxy-6-metoxy-1,4-benzoquinol methylase
MTLRSAVGSALTAARTAFTATSARVARLFGRRYFTTEYFERRFEQPDPWGFEHREYERVKYQRTLDALPEQRYARILEIGCAEGLLTESLAERGTAVLATDVSERALSRARVRLADRRHVRFARSDVFADRLTERFDLVVASEVLCFAESLPMLDGAIERLTACIEPGGHVVLVHLRIATEHPTGWPPVDLLFGADVIHRRAASLPGLALLSEQWEDRYAISVYRRSAN